MDGKECAPKYGLIASLKYLMTGKVKSYTHFISLARSAKCLKKFQKINDKYGSLRRFLLHVSVNKTNKQAYIRFFGLKVSFSKLIWRKM